MMLASTTRIVLLSFLCGFLPQLVLAEPWPIKEFRVFPWHPDPPSQTKVDYAYLLEALGNAPEGYGDSENEKYEQYLADMGNSPEIPDEVVSEIENWLNTLAGIYERMEFREPHYTDVESSIFSQQQVFRVYIYHFSRGSPARMLSPCGTSDEIRLRMELDSRRNIVNNRLTSKAYQDLAHELFHAVQNSYPMLIKNNCEMGEWIREGTAEAVGIEMARRYANKDPNHICQIGLRRYDRTLYTNDENQGADAPCAGMSLDYQAQSFWQFLGEYTTRSKKIATEEFAVPDFSYLHGFFETRHPVGSRQNEFAWLDKALRKARKSDGRIAFGIGLQRTYARFAGTFASYWKENRRAIIEGQASANPADDEKKWLEWVYKDCPEVLVSKDATAAVDIDIAAVAARCIQMNFDATGRFKLAFYASADNPGIDLESIAISADGGKKIIRHHATEQNPDRIGHFSIDAESGKPQYLIVSHAPRNPAQTNGIEVKLLIEPEFIDTSKAKAKKEPGDGSESTAEKELANAWASRSWKGAARQRERTPCTRPFEASPCGPTTYLNLQMVTDTAQLLDEVSQPALVRSERMIEVLGAIEERGAAQLPMDLIKGINEIRSLDGWEVRITLPQIQPGFTGSIDNAHIRVAKAVNPDGSANGDWRAIGPEWQGSCRDGFHPASGMVTFSSFTEKSAHGSFSAKLIDVEYSPGCQAAPVDTTINGDFIITSVDLGDSMPVPQVSDEDILEDVIEDTNELLPGFISEEMREYLKEQVNNNEPGEAEQSQEQGTGRDTRATASDLDRCGCSCELESQLCSANPGAECCQLCEPLFKMCRQAVTGHQSTTPQPTHTDDDHKALRQRYEAYVDSIAPNPMAKQQLMAAFDALKTIDEKKLFMMAIPHAH